MRYLVIAPQLGFTASGSIVAGGLQQFGRCLVRALASSPTIKKLGIWSQIELPEAEPFIQNMVKVHAHDQLALDVRGFGGNRVTLATAVAMASWQRTYDRVMYLLINQAVLSLLPGHLPYTVWEIGEEVFEPVPRLKYQALKRADSLLSISHNTTQATIHNNPGLPTGRVVHLCLEPPIFESEPGYTPATDKPYQPVNRESAVLIVGSMYRRTPYKGHKQLIAAWPEIVRSCPKAELWIVGGGDSQYELEMQANALSPSIARQILFLGQLDNLSLQERYRRCRVFAMPSTGEGFGLVFVEAARYGLPSIGGKYDSVKEIVLNDQTGLLVEQSPHEIALACIRLLTDDALAKRLGDAALQRYMNYFSFQHFRQRLLQTLELEE